MLLVYTSIIDLMGGGSINKYTFNRDVIYRAIDFVGVYKTE